MVLFIGPKHSGKTSAGRALAALWDGDFIDLDELTAAQTGESPRGLYKKGPQVFRDAEAAALESLLREAPEPGRPRIAAAGGGLIDNDRAMALLKKAPGVMLVYLEVSPETAWERISRGNGELPPFLNTADPRGTHFELHTRRAGAYKKAARHVVQAEGKSPEEIAGELHRLFL